MFSYIFVYQTYTHLYDTLSSVLPCTAVGRDGSEAESNARGKKTYQQTTNTQNLQHLTQQGKSDQHYSKSSTSDTTGNILHKRGNLTRCFFCCFCGLVYISRGNLGVDVCYVGVDLGAQLGNKTSGMLTGTGFVQYGENIIFYNVSPIYGPPPLP